MPAMSYHPTHAIALVVLAILLAMASWSWLRSVKYPTNANRDLAARTTAWALGFGAIGCLLLLLDLTS